MNTCQRAVVKGPRCQNFAEFYAPHFLQHQIRPRRHFEAGHQGTTEHFRLAGVRRVVVIEIDLHGAFSPAPGLCASD